MSTKRRLEQARLLKESLRKLRRACDILDEIEKRLNRRMSESMAA